VDTRPLAFLDIHISTLRALFPDKTGRRHRHQVDGDQVTSTSVPLKRGTPSIPWSPLPIHVEIGYRSTHGSLTLRPHACRPPSAWPESTPRRPRPSRWCHGCDTPTSMPGEVTVGAEKGQRHHEYKAASSWPHWAEALAWFHDTCGVRWSSSLTVRRPSGSVATTRRDALVCASPPPLSCEDISGAPPCIILATYTTAMPLRE
jgi:hypothetical protein